MSFDKNTIIGMAKAPDFQETEIIYNKWLRQNNLIEEYDSSLIAPIGLHNMIAPFLLDVNYNDILTPIYITINKEVKLKLLEL